jgi:hypothetical protein
MRPVPTFATHESAYGPARRLRMSAPPLSGDNQTSNQPTEDDAPDPSARLAMHSGPGFEGGFSLYQSTHLNR